LAVLMRGPHTSMALSCPSDGCAVVRYFLLLFFYAAKSGRARVVLAWLGLHALVCTLGSVLDEGMRFLKATEHPLRRCFSVQIWHGAWKPANCSRGYFTAAACGQTLHGVHAGYSSHVLTFVFKHIKVCPSRKIHVHKRLHGPVLLCFMFARSSCGQC